MKLFIALCLIAVVAAAPQAQINYSNNEPQVVSYENDNTGFGNYRYAYEQSDGTVQGAVGTVKNEGREDQSYVVKGVYAWLAPNGVYYIVRYQADEEGFKPEIEEAPGVSGGLLASALG